MTVRWSKHGVRRNALIVAFCDWFGISDPIADVLLALYDNQGRSMTWQALATAADSHRPPTQGALHMRICDLRKAMDCEAVDCERGEGYSLTEIGVAECNKALSLMGQRLMAIGGDYLGDVDRFKLPSGAVLARPVQKRDDAA